MRPFGTILGPFWDHFGPILGPIFGYYQFDVWTNLRPIVLFQKLSNEVSFNALPHFFCFKKHWFNNFLPTAKSKSQFGYKFPPIY